MQLERTSRDEIRLFLKRGEQPRAIIPSPHHPRILLSPLYQRNSSPMNSIRRPNISNISRLQHHKISGSAKRIHISTTPPSAAHIIPNNTIPRNRNEISCINSSSQPAHKTMNLVRISMFVLSSVGEMRGYLYGRVEEKLIGWEY